MNSQRLLSLSFAGQYLAFEHETSWKRKPQSIKFYGKQRPNLPCKSVFWWFAALIWLNILYSCYISCFLLLYVMWLLKLKKATLYIVRPLSQPEKVDSWLLSIFMSRGGLFPCYFVIDFKDRSHEAAYKCWIHNLLLFSGDLTMLPQCAVKTSQTYQRDPQTLRCG